MRFLTLLTLVSALGCRPSQPTAPTSQMALAGSGSTFVYPLFSKWIPAYEAAHPGVRIAYQPIGSGAGQQQILERAVDFAASDASLTEGEAAKSPGLVQIPVACGAVVIAYRLAGVPKLRLTPDTLAGIFLGDITNWSDPVLKRENPGVVFPDLPISVIHRSDGSGTTTIFTDYLSKVSAQWRSGPGSGKVVSWPTGAGFSGTHSVSAIVKNTGGAIGYVELSYAEEGRMSTAELRNRDGEFVAPSLEGIAAAAQRAVISDDFRGSMADQPGKGTWPITGFSSVLFQGDEGDPTKRDAILRLLWWGIHEGQPLGAPLHYAPLPTPLVSKIERRLLALAVAGKPPLNAPPPLKP